ncbi:hypothetical protein [Acidaminobacter hydrogenoformans]|uniref:DUF2089 domain-containing protein n=1 Tax=Acidaminobacter hydrogenoformans DSM 2784 TaxID=1120920 RepID=A0A1G5S1S9_9FIRM|nr:hypothetical protein [Acidaminobacter hydrogenoformans]SCZ79830.1 hypothetical protein SAMN03080599_01954 [Acidaminobacter hydrogenoformans DSM 2784]
MTILELLEQVERGDITAEEATIKIRAPRNGEAEALPALTETEAPAKWLKIRIVDPASSFRMSLPPLPLRFTSRLAAFLFKLSMKHSDAQLQDAIDPKDIARILETFKTLPPVQLVSVEDDQGTQIDIFTK